ncbi:phosphate ABC transporter substrate-binding/OmpA family protein [Pseudomonas sp. TNT2022 ID681]|uniref:Phosphate ABC transporter substrate-binding/OmpA family protein n=1 Tax=Pseudomonas fontis TaxID=2942633 RepID=A0ABT5NVC7_9PSED|nr:phosphate ABC transporter substrate-binding/OmpA family protein [Pseudomonas fontis]MDD0974161.1 phosphate ABC transporter substrate-binding/OmpA family protein [Pseudomonas fontis]MDD0992092.1 phosphate ABC transporter substrate-binding/OmpA family protein [Pseudomonas fontis]
MYRALIALCFTLLALPAFAANEDAPALRLQGSNTIGAALAPALVRGLLAAQGLGAIETLPTAVANEVIVQGRDAQGNYTRVAIAAHGTSTGFSALKAGQAEMAAASRPIKDSEWQELRAFGDLKRADAEHVIALDGVAVIVHPDNPLPQLTTAQLAEIFSGKLRNWSELGIGSGPIHLYARDDRSGTFETFKALVLDPHQQSLAANARRFEAADELANEVRHDRLAIGFSSLSSVHGNKVLAIADGHSQAMLPSPGLIASEDYPLARRLYFYLPAGQRNPLARALLDFTQQAQGQAIVASNGFIGQQVTPLQVDAQDEQPPRYRRLATSAQRLSVNFRFQEGNASLDNKALRDVQRVVEYLRQNDKLQQKVVLVGFGDAKDDTQRADLLSRLRALAVRRELAKNGVDLREVIGLGDEMPVAANNDEQGRIRNRRVEVWVY